MRWDSINKAKQMMQRTRATPVVRHASYEDDVDFEFRRPSGTNTVKNQEAVGAGQ